MASLILDGKLLSQEPTKLSTFMPELKYSCTTISDIESHPRVQRLQLAYQWSREFLKEGGRLIVMLTAKLELSAPQVSYHYVITVIKQYCIHLVQNWVSDHE